jgi:hypothetical protein
MGGVNIAMDLAINLNAPYERYRTRKYLFVLMLFCTFFSDFQFTGQKTKGRHGL